MKKQTSIKWFIEKMLSNNYINDQQYENCKSWLLDEAEDLHKDEVMLAYNQGWLQCHIEDLPERSRKRYRDAEEYFKETFNIKSNE